METRAFLGLSTKRANWSECNNDVGDAFSESLDNFAHAQTWLYVANLLERGVRVLNYAGTFDFICEFPRGSIGTF